jgi:hypothetical protein
MLLIFTSSGWSKSSLAAAKALRTISSFTLAIGRRAATKPLPLRQAASIAVAARARAIASALPSVYGVRSRIGTAGSGMARTRQGGTSKNKTKTKSGPLESRAEMRVDYSYQATHSCE